MKINLYFEIILLLFIKIFLYVNMVSNVFDLGLVYKYFRRGIKND